MTQEAATVKDAIKYAEDVVSGNIVSSKYVRLQCQAFLNDINTNQHRQDCRWNFSEAKANHALGFMQLLKFVEGTVAGQPFRLSPWQAFIIANSFGWVDKEDGDIRRYTRLVCLVARKNAKSTLLAAMALYELQYAPEGSQLVTMATQREQAKLVWGMSARMANMADPRLLPGFNQTVSTISNKDKWTRYTPLSKESKRLDGLSIRLAIVDEAAAIQDDNLINVVTSSMGAQKSPQIVYISTGQPGAESNPFMSVLDYGKKVLDGTITDERILTLAYQIDEGDDWDNPDVWIKANPNLGLSVSTSFLEEELHEAQSIPSKAANFKTKYLNQFLSTAEAWLSVDIWNANTVPNVDTDMPLYVGMDLGATSDLTAVSMVWAKDGKFHVDFQAWVPEQAFRDAPKHVRAVYDQAREDGSLRVTEGEVSDHDAVYDYMLELAEKYELEAVCFDSWSAVHLTSRLTDQGLPMIRYDQSMKALSPASKEVELLVRNGQLQHLGKPFFNWCLSNAEVYTDVNENIKVRKGKDPALKIDPIIAMIMAVGRATINGAQKTSKFTFYM